ncbi:MAG: hypothetical protein QNJ32_12855 [Xenococcaceae cyanobacterium MO_167.B27]|nr:hypothetical protein [Xenococcaceae cyanobacterium MO_167.B27]
MAINSKSTKAEILAAYKALEKEKKALEAGAKRETKPTNNGTTTKPKSHQVIGKSSTMEQTIKTLQQLQLNFGSAVSNLSEQLIAEATTLQEIQEFINQEQQQLKELHNLSKIEEDTIDNLIQQYEENSKQFQEEYSQSLENSQQEIEDLKKAWAKEKENYYREGKQRNETREKAKHRELEEYQYNLDLARDLDEEEYERQKQLLYKELEETRKQQEKQWQEKEESIAKQEEEYATAKQKVAEFEEQLKAKVKRGEEEGKGIGNYQGKVKSDLRNKEIQGEKQNYQLRIQSLEATIQNQEARIHKLSDQLDMAQKQVQDLAVKAIEGSSNRKSFEAMKEIAMEQAKTPQKNK